MCAFLFEYSWFYFCRYNPRGGLKAQMVHWVLILINAFQKACKQLQFCFLREDILISIPTTKKCYCSLWGEMISQCYLICMSDNQWVWTSISWPWDFLLMDLFFHISCPFLVNCFPLPCQYFRALHFVKEYTQMSKVCYVKYIYITVTHKFDSVWVFGK